MEHLLATYLYQQKICPLPGIGTLALTHVGAQVNHAQKEISASGPTIRFDTNEAEAGGLTSYLSNCLHISEEMAGQQLDEFCKKIQQLFPQQKHALANAGFFKKNTTGELEFECKASPAIFLPNIVAERVIHPNTTHNMLVGDTHTDTGAMQQRLMEATDKKRATWLIWAAGLAVVCIAAIAFYYWGGQPGPSGFGNQQKINPASQPGSTYIRAAQ